MKVRLSRPAAILAIALGAVVLLGLAAIIVGTLAGPSPSRTATGPVNGVRTATFELLDGATSVRLKSGPSGTPVRVTAASGAGTVTLDGQVHQGVAGGQSFTANGWQAGGPGVDVRAQAGAGVVQVSAG